MDPPSAPTRRAPPPIARTAPTLPTGARAHDERRRTLGPIAMDVVDPRRRCVLVVEDNDVLRDGMSAMLDDAGWVVVEASSLDDARELLDVAHPNMLVLDYNLHGEYASVLLDEMAHAHRTTPTVLVSACPLAFDAARAYGLVLVQKPFELGPWMRVLDDVMARASSSIPRRVAP